MFSSHYPIIFTTNLSPNSYISLELILSYIYEFFTSVDHSQIATTKIRSFSMNVLIEEFSFKLDNNLFLYNSTNMIKIVSIFPQFYPIESKLCDKFRQLPIKNICPASKSVFYPKSKLQKQTLLPVKIRAKTEKISNPLLDSSIYNTFLSDKNSYLLMKSDIQSNILKKNNIPSQFQLKFDIFSILESRNLINDSKDSSPLEFNAYTTLWNEINNEISLPNPNPKLPSKAVYVPHNYNFFSDEQKIAHAKKYKLSRKEFEDKYLSENAPTDELQDAIEKINKSTYLSIKNDEILSCAREESEEEELDSDSDIENSPEKQIDPSILEIIKEF